MTRQTRSILIVVAAAVLGTVGVQARQDSTKAAPPPVIPVKVDVVISRYQGDKKTGNLPFTLMVNTNGNPTTLRVGVDVPVGTTTTTTLPEGNRQGATTTQPSYRNIGTSIDCRASTLIDGRFSLYVSVVDSSIFTADAEARTILKAADPAAFREFRASNYLTFKDGQTQQLTTATDKVSGETLKIDVTLTVLK